MSDANTFKWNIKWTGIRNVAFPAIKYGIKFQGGNVDGFYLPGHENNGDYILVESTLVSYYNNARTLVWSKTTSEISGNTSNSALYFSSVDDKYYIISYSYWTGGARGYIKLSSLDKTNGNSTNLSAQIEIGVQYFTGSQLFYSGLSQLPSGNLVFVSGEQFGRVVEFTNTGTVISNTDIIQNGVNLYRAKPTGELNITYQSEDRTIFAGMDDGMLYIAKNGAYRIITDYLTDHILGYNILTAWNGYIMSLDKSSTSYPVKTPVFYIRSDFDRWLNDICFAVGL